MYFGLGFGLGYRPMMASTPAPFTPMDLSDLKLWLDASDISTITQAGGSVSQWNDKSGNASHATQGIGASQPVTGTRSINALNVLDFDGTNDFLAMSSGLYTITNANITLFIVYGADTTNTTQNIIAGSTSSSSNNRFVYIQDSANNRVRAGSRNSTPYDDLSISPNTAQHIGGLLKSGLNVKALYDGVLNIPGVVATHFTAYNINLGSGSNGTAYFNGTIAEVLIYGAALSNHDMNLVGNYLATKWGASWAGL